MSTFETYPGSQLGQDGQLHQVEQASKEPVPERFLKSFKCGADYLEITVAEANKWAREEDVTILQMDTFYVANYWVVFLLLVEKNFNK